ncbi:hypothetical protein ABK040_007547 [Willaertia magna]
MSITNRPIFLLLLFIFMIHTFILTSECKIVPFNETDYCPTSQELYKPQICDRPECICGSGKLSCCTLREQKIIQSTVDNLMKRDSYSACHQTTLEIMCLSCSPNLYFHFNPESETVNTCVDVCYRIYDECANARTRDGVAYVINSKLDKFEYCNNNPRYSNSTDCWNSAVNLFSTTQFYISIIITFIAIYLSKSL